MSDSILVSIKKMLGPDEDYEAYDTDIITHINTAFMILNQNGIGPDDCFRIEDESTVWDEFVQGDNMLNAAKTYVYNKVKLMFDPPQNSFLKDSMEETNNEIIWRLREHCEKKREEASITGGDG